MPATRLTNSAATASRGIGLSLCIVGIGLLSPSCSSDRTQLPHPPGDSPPGMPAIDPPKASPTAKAEELVTAGTEALARQAVADHVLTPEERALVGVFWAGILISQRTGEVPPEFLETGLTNRVAELAKSYPSFFKVDGAGGIHLLNISSPVSCKDNCYPSWQDVVGTALSARGVVQHLRGIVPIGLDEEVFSAFKTALKAGVSPAKAVMVAASGGGTDKLIEAVGGALISGAALVTIGTKAAAAVAAVGAVWSVFWISYNVTTAALDFQRCRSFQSTNCCDPKCAAPVVGCQGNSVVTDTESCTNRVCIPSTTVTKVCAAPTRACNGPLLTMTTESCAVGACASNTTVVQDCQLTLPPKAPICSGPAETTVFTPACTQSGGAAACDYVALKAACPPGDVCHPATGSCDPCAGIGPDQQCLSCGGKRGPAPVGATCCPYAISSFSPCPATTSAAIDPADKTTAYCLAGSACQPYNSRFAATIAVCVAAGQWFEKPCAGGVGPADGNGIGLCTNGATIDCATNSQQGVGSCCLLQ